MADAISVDFSDLRRLVTQIEGVSEELPPGLVRAVAVSALKVKKQWKLNLDRSDVPASGSTIQYEVIPGEQTVEAVIESNRGTKKLMGYAYAREFGSITVAPAGDGAAALQATTSDFERGVGIAGQRAIERALNR